MKQLIEHRLEVAEYNLDMIKDKEIRHGDTILALEVRIQELRDILKELERVEIKPEPQPIEKLFELKEDTVVWVKFPNGEYDYGIYDSYRERLRIDGMSYSKGEIRLLDSFLIAEVPKF